MGEVWVLGATGRTGRAIAALLAEGGTTPVLVGRDADRLARIAEQSGGAPVVVATSVEETIAAIERQQPSVVVNTVGPFARTAVPIARAALAAGHALDLANDAPTTAAVLDLDPEARSAGRTVVTGAGFGVTATESVVLRLCEDRPAAARVRTDMVPSVEIEAGVLGEALAATIVDGLPHGGSRYAGGRLVRSRLAGEPLRLTLPDGSTVTTAAMPLGELVAAQRASGAADVLAGSSEAPSGRVVRGLLPVAGLLLRARPMRAFATRRLAAVRVDERTRPREHSWAHAQIAWPDGTVRHGWLRLGSASAFTAAVAAEVARRLLRDEGRPGAFTPGALFGAGLALACGGVNVDDGPINEGSSGAAP